MNKYRLILPILIGLLSVTAGTGLFGQSLDDYIEEALDNHPRINAVEAERKSDLERAEQAHVLPDPVLTAGVFLFPVETRVGPQRGNISAMQQFPWFGTLDAEREAHLAAARTEEVKLEQERMILKRSLRKSYYDLYGRAKKADWQRKLIESLRTIEQLAEMNYSQGKATMADVVRIQIEREEAVFQLSDLEEMESALLADFNAIMHRPKDITVALPDTLEMNPPAQSAEDRWTEHPEYRRFQNKRTEWEAKQEVTDKKRMPSFGLGLNYILTAEREIEELQDNGKDALLPMVQLRLPIWSEKYDREKEALRWKAKAVEHRQESWKDEWERQLADVSYVMNRAERRYEVLEDQIKATRRASRLLISAYRNAEANIDEVLRLEMQLIQYRKEQVEQLVRFNKAKAQWHYLINHKR